MPRFPKKEEMKRGTLERENASASENIREAGRGFLSQWRGNQLRGVMLESRPALLDQR